MPESFGRFAVGLLWLSLAITLAAIGYMVYRRLKKRTLSSQLSALISIIALLLVVPFVRVYALRCHSIFHDFTTMFFAGAVALVPFVFMPLLLKEAGVIQTSSITIKLSKYRQKVLWLPIILLLVAATYAASEHYRFSGLFPEANASYPVYGAFIADNVGYQDIVFSPDYEAAALPSQQIIYTKKQIHKVETVEDISKITEKVSGDYRIKIFVKDSKDSVDVGLQMLINQATGSKTISVAGQQAILYDIPVSAL